MSQTASSELVSDATKQTTENLEEALNHREDASEIILHVIACSCACCSNFDASHQPRDLDQSKNSFGQVEHRNSKRSIQTSWYDKHLWISVCTSSYKVFCHVCCSARKHDMITFSKGIKLTFVEGGGFQLEKSPTTIWRA